MLSRRIRSRRFTRVSGARTLRRPRAPVTVSTVATKSYVKRKIAGIARMRHIPVQQTAGQEITSTTDIVNLIPTISQGDSFDDREGDEIDMRSLVGYIQLSRDTAATATTSDRVRVTIFKWFPNNVDDAPTSDMIYADTSTGEKVYSQYTAQTADRKKFKVLYDRLFVIGPRGTDVGNGFRRIRLLMGSKKLGRIFYNAGAQTGRGIIYMAITGTFGTGNDTSDYVYNSTLKFVSD